MAEQVLGFRIEVKGTDQQTAALSKLGASTDQLKARIKLLNDIQRKGTPLTQRQAKERALLTTQLKANTVQYNKLNKSILQNNGVTQKSESFTKKMGKSIAGAGAAMFGIGAAIGVVTRVLGSAVKTFIEFEKTNSQLKAVLGDNGTAGAMKQLSDQSKALGSVTSFTATSVAQLQVEFAKLGFPTNDILNMTKATLDGAAALGSDLAEQAALTGATLKQFGLDSTETGRVVDVMASAASKSALDFSKLNTALPIVGATAATAGVSLERTTALLGTLSDRGIDASSSGTALRNMFLELSKQGLTYDEAMAKINTSTDKNATAMELFGKRGATAGVILAGTAAATDKLEDSLNNANGAARLMAQTMLDNLSGDITIAQSAWEGLILSFEDGNGILSKLTRSVTTMGTTYLNMLTSLNNNDIDGISGAWLKHIDVVDDTAVSYKVAGKIIDDNGKLTRQAATTIVLSQEDLLKAAQNNELALSLLKKQFNAGAIDAAKFQRGVEMLAGGFKVLTAAEREAKDAAKSEAAVQAEQDALTLKLQNELAANAELDKADEARNKKSAAASQRRADEELRTEQKLADDKLKLQRDSELLAEQTVNDLLAIHYEDDRKEALNQIELKFQEKIAKITGDSAIEIEAKKMLVQAQRDALAEQQLEFDEMDAEVALEEKELRLENEMILAEEDFARQREILEQQRALDLTNETLTTEQKRAVNLEYDKQDAQIVEAQKARRLNTNMAILGGASDLAGSLSSLAKEGSEEQKKLAVVSAVINGAQAVMGILSAQYTGIGFVDAALKAIAIVGVVAKTRSQIQTINSAKMEHGGLVEGASHDAGGIQMYHKSGEHLGEMEGNEYIISAKRTREIGVSNLDAMNFGGEAPSTQGFFANGGSVPNVRTSQAAQQQTDRQQNLEQLAAVVSMEMQSAIIRTPVVNNASDTFQVAAEVQNQESELSFG